MEGNKTGLSTNIKYLKGEKFIINELITFTEKYPS
jgi:hypothetical protein